MQVDGGSAIPQPVQYAEERGRTNSTSCTAEGAIKKHFIDILCIALHQYVSLFHRPIGYDCFSCVTTSTCPQVAVEMLRLG